MAEKTKLSRKDLKGPDEFVTALGSGVSWLRENRTKVIAAAAVAVLVVVGALGARSYFRWQQEKASRDLWAHVNKARDFVQAPTAADAEKLAMLESALSALAAANPRSEASLYARYYIGGIAFRRKDYEASAANYRAALALVGDKGIMPYLVRQGLAQALESKGDLAGAASVYGEAAAASAGELRAEALLAKARVLLAQGNRGEAAETYRRILADVPGTSLKDLVEIRLSQLG